MNTKVRRSTTAISRELEIPVETFDFYAERAIKSGRNVEDELLRTLDRCRDHNDASPIYLNDSQRNELSQLAGRLIRTPEDVIAWAKTMCTIRVGGVDIALSTQLAKRLETRCFGSTMPELLRRIVTEQLEQVVGMR